MKGNETKHLKAFRNSKLKPSEKILGHLDGWIGEMMGQGDKQQHNGQFVLTNLRVCFYRKGVLGEVFQTIPVGNITSIETLSRMGCRVLRLHTSHDDLAFKTFESKELFETVCDALESARLDKQPLLPPNEVVAAPLAQSKHEPSSNLTAESLKAAARGGDTNALEALMNKSFGPKGTTVRVTNSGSLLRVVLQGAEAPDKALLPLIQKGLGGIKPAGFEKVVVSARATGKGDVWTETWQLATTNTEAKLPPANSTKTPKPVVKTLVSNSQPPKWYLKSWMVVSLLVLFPFLGVPFVWLTQWSKSTKIVSSAFGSLWILIILFGGGTDVETASEPVPVAPPQETATPAPQYEATAVPAPQPVAPPPQSTNSSADKPPEELLAIIDGVPSSAGVYARLLDQLEPKCTENRMLIADMTVKSVQLAGNEGVRTNNLEMLNGLHTVLSDVDFEMKCAEIYAAVITIMAAE